MKKVLVIEDNEVVRENTADLLLLANYEVETAENGRIGVEKALEFLPDVIICDIMMPELDGYGVLEALQTQENTKCIPFVFLTAKAEKSDMRKGMNLGADDYLTKPFEEHELIESIESRLNKNAFLKKEFSKNAVGLNDFLEKASDYLGLEKILKSFDATRFKKSENIFSEGSVANTLFFIENGTIKTYRTTESGKEFVTGLYNSGDFLGQLALITDQGVYTETATVMEDAQVHKIPKKDFIKLLYGNHAVSSKFISLISNNLVEMQDKVVSMAFATVRQKLAKTLLKLQEKGILSNNEDETISIHRDDLAGIIGTATETAIRMLTKFKEEGLIDIGANSRILIRNKQALEHISCFN
ncbi:transcriptional regulator [Putridiphycobacter roseus]|uniref:Transcriptional regulator n=1 Tax=Putridiphycobacter roseus TaxID=2219161 RepID=A0A2W1NPG5_9FLAO|nr:response regulator [Putridiphycobacter roseus]PZE17522.1 transcriptional regulator [Putridiphycobacter roseus]